MKFNVTITRTSWSSKDFEVEAENDTDACEKALLIAGDTVFDSDGASYEVENSEELEDE